jgi:hypothetical protein
MAITPWFLSALRDIGANPVGCQSGCRSELGRTRRSGRGLPCTALVDREELPQSTSPLRDRRQEDGLVLTLLR